ncbi:MAG TPA: hypothetical protein VK524_12330 [Polyangiaceae bacterium]|nr:hypothetical protein [Polyangiaceae bacterium]
MSRHSAVSRPIRLAERDALAVDICPCGTLAVHVGALSLRLDLESVTSLIAILNEAVAERDRLISSPRARVEGAPSDRGLYWSSSASDQRRGKA